MSRVALILLVAAVFAAFYLTEPLPQDPNYHRFADTRQLMGVPNFMDVASNLPLLLAGACGLVAVSRTASGPPAIELRVTYGTFFCGVLLTAFGSAYYHLQPSHESLFWDRLPMTIAFAGLFAAVIAQFVSRRAGLQLLAPFLILGLASVAYWRWSEGVGAGDLRPYAAVQFLPMIAIPLILWFHRGNSRLGRYFAAMIGLYVAAKLCEHFDAGIYAALHVSGHSLKHILSGLAPAVLVYGLLRAPAAEQSSG